MTGTYQAFLSVLGYSESTNRYEFVNSLGYAGRYQFGEVALKMTGYYQSDGTSAVDWNNGWTGKDGISSISEWLNNPKIQDKAVGEWFNYLWDTEIKDLGLQQYVGKTINGVQVTESGILAGSHLVGAAAVGEYLNSGGAKGATDPFGTPVSEYIAKFSGYAVDPVFGATTSAPTETSTAAPIQAPSPDPVSAPIPAPSPAPTPAPSPAPVSAPAGEALTGTHRADKLVGGVGNDTVRGMGGKDHMSGGGGGDHLWGGWGSDSFVFKAGFGHDTIEDFATRGSGHDYIDFSSDLFSGLSAVLSHTTDTPEGALITLDDASSLLVKGVLKSSLVAADFHFL
jgi:serralysin